MTVEKDVRQARVFCGRDVVLHKKRGVTPIMQCRHKDVVGEMVDGHVKPVPTGPCECYC